MAKRRLSKQQSQRIKANQRDRLASAETDTTTVGPEESGLVLHHFGRKAEVECIDGKIIRSAIRQNLGVIVAGDRIVWSRQPDGSPVIVAVHPRTSILGRPDKHGHIKPIAANISQLLIVIASQPIVVTSLLDSYLVAAELLNLPPVIVLNKSDLLTGKEAVYIEELIASYQRIGYKTLHVSTYTDHGLDELQQQLDNNTSVLTGQSGVGKSSIIQSILPKQDIRVGPLSDNSGLGTHTTSNSKLYHLQSGGSLIDSPGIREFGLWHLKPEDIAKGFIEFKAALSECKFRDCSHRLEPGCAIKAGVESGEISKIRYENFIKLTS